MKKARRRPKPPSTMLPIIRADIEARIQAMLPGWIEDYPARRKSIVTMAGESGLSINTVTRRLRAAGVVIAKGGGGG